MNRYLDTVTPMKLKQVKYKGKRTRVTLRGNGSKSRTFTIYGISPDRAFDVLRRLVAEKIEGSANDAREPDRQTA